MNQRRWGLPLGGIKSSKVDQGDLVFDVRSGFASGFVCRPIRLQVSVYSGYDLCQLGYPKIWLVHFDPVTLKSTSNPRLLCIHVRCTHDANLVTAGPQVPEILHMRWRSSLKPFMDQSYDSLGRCRTPIVVVNALDQLSISCTVLFRRYRPLNLPLSCEVFQKRWFLCHRFTGGGDTPDLGHAFSNRSHFQACGRFWLSSVQRARRLG